MNFKEWLILSESIDANTKNLLAKQKAPKDQLDTFIKELEGEPTIIDKPTAFQRFQAKFVTNKEKPKEEDAQRKHFATIPNTTEEELQTYDHYKKESPQSLKEMMELLRKFIEKKIITLKIENKVPAIIRNTTQGSQKIDTPDFTRFMSSLHGIQGILEKYKGKGNYFNPIEEELNHQQNLVAKGDNIWVFKGLAPDVCRIYGKGHPWCISSSTSAAHWFTYRIEHHQTQYFVFDYNKDENDPARYVNPGVSPEGMYSEWVDARNTHSTDPEDSESEVGINGYNSINEYKKYLVSKGIPESTWTTIPPEDWEERLHQYYEDEDFTSAKNDKHPEVFPMYLKIVNRMEDSDFDTLTDGQKKESLLGKNHYRLTNKQVEYVMKEFKGEYYNSLSLEHKIDFAVKTMDKEKIIKFVKNPEFTDNNLADFFVNASNATDKNKMAELIINEKPKLSDKNVWILLYHATDKDKMAESIINKKPELSDKNVEQLLYHATDKDKIAESIINKKPELSDKNVEQLLNVATDKDKMAESIIKYKTELSDRNVYNLFSYAENKEKIAKLLGKNNINKIFSLNIKHLLEKNIDIEKIAEILGTYNISKLSESSISWLLNYSPNKKQMAQIINKYHTNKTPEIKELISKYL